MQNVEQNVTLFEQMLSCVYKNLYLWRYDSELRLTRSSCPNESILQALLIGSGCMDYLSQYAHNNREPLLLSSPIGLIWIAAFENEDDKLSYVHLLGPAIISDSSRESIRLAQKVLDNMKISLQVQQELSQVMENLPVISHVYLSQLAPMLHYCVTGQKLGISDINSQHHVALPGQLEAPPQRDRYQAWRAGQTLMRVVREGDLNYRQVLNNMSGISTGVAMQSQENLRQVKDTAIVFSSMCTLAAIEGGLSPEIAYTIGDGYIQSIENAKAFSDIVSLDSTMFGDFVQRVHKVRANSVLSKQIQKCCDYIQQHLEDDLSIDMLARQAGYTKYYLSRKFAEETGTPLPDYIRQARIDYSKHLLAFSEDSIQQIADRLQFCSRSHFTSTFRKITGIAPIEYRESNQRI